MLNPTPSITLILIVILSLNTCSKALAKMTVLRAGAAQVDITPEAGVQLGGDVGSYRPAEFALDPIYAKALVLEHDGRKLCFVTLDLLAITKHYSTKIRELAAGKFGFEQEAVMISAIQSHTAPALGHYLPFEDLRLPPESDWLRGGDDEYYSFAVERIIEAIELAHSALEPVKMGVDSGIEGRVIFNRRMVMRDGSIGMPYGPNPRYRYLEGPIDPELGVMCLRTDSLRILAMLVNYTCHPVNVFPKPIVSADWPGSLANELREAYGKECVPLILNGACGNINPYDPFDPHYAKDHLRMGHILAETAGKVVETLKYRDDIVLDWRSRHLKIPIRELNPMELEKAQKVLAENPEPVWIDSEHEKVDPEWIFAAILVDRYNQRQRNPEYDCEIQVLRVGNAAFVGWPGEPFVEGGLQVKLKSPTFPTYIVHNTSTLPVSVGYLPTKQAFEAGGHEITWSRLVPDALDTIVEETIDLLKELFQE